LWLNTGTVRGKGILAVQAVMQKQIILKMPLQPSFGTVAVVTGRADTTLGRSEQLSADTWSIVLARGGANVFGH
jgi:hypothetical protein